MINAIYYSPRYVRALIRRNPEEQLEQEIHQTNLGRVAEYAYSVCPLLRAITIGMWRYMTSLPCDVEGIETHGPDEPGPLMVNASALTDHKRPTPLVNLAVRHAIGQAHAVMTSMTDRRASLKKATHALIVGYLTGLMYLLPTLANITIVLPDRTSAWNPLAESLPDWIARVGAQAVVCEWRNLTLKQAKVWTPRNVRLHFLTAWVPPHLLTALVGDLPAIANAEYMQNITITDARPIMGSCTV